MTTTKTKIGQADTGTVDFLTRALLEALREATDELDVNGMWADVEHLQASIWTLSRLEACTALVLDHLRAVAVRAEGS